METIDNPGGRRTRSRQFANVPWPQCQGPGTGLHMMKGVPNVNFLVCVLILVNLYSHVVFSWCYISYIWNEIYGQSSLPYSAYWRGVYHYCCLPYERYLR